jgi:hypothetical protein
MSLTPVPLKLLRLGLVPAGDPLRDRVFLTLKLDRLRFIGQPNIFRHSFRQPAHEDCSVRIRNSLRNNICGLWANAPAARYV